MADPPKIIADLAKHFVWQNCGQLAIRLPGRTNVLQWQCECTGMEMEVLTLVLAAIFTLVMFIWSKKKIATSVTNLADKEEKYRRTSPTNNMEEKPEQASETPVAVVKREINVLLRSLHEDDVDASAEPPSEMLSPDDTVGDAKKKLGLQGRRLVFRAMPLDDAKTLEQNGVREGATLYVTPADTVALQVRSITGKSLALRFNTTDRVAILRNKVESVLGVEGRHQALVLRGTELDDVQTLGETGVKDGDVVHVVMRFRGGENSWQICSAEGLSLYESEDDSRSDFSNTEEDGDQDHGRSGTKDPVDDNDNDKGHRVSEQDEYKASRIKSVKVKKDDDGELWYENELLLNLVDLGEERLYMVEARLSWTVDELKNVITRALLLDDNVSLSHRNCEMQGDDQLLELYLTNLDLLVLRRSNAPATSALIELH